MDKWSPGELKEDLLRVGAPAEPTNAIYLPRFFRAERRLPAEYMPCAQREHHHEGTSQNQLGELLRQLSESNKVDLSPQQQDAVRAALSSKLSVLTVDRVPAKRRPCRCSFTPTTRRLRLQVGIANRASRQRLAEATGVSASTSHRMLSFSAEIGALNTTKITRCR